MSSVRCRTVEVGAVEDSTPQKSSVTFRWILVAGIVLRILFFLISDNNGGDALARVASLQQWMQNPSLAAPLPQWGPGYFYLMAPFAYLLGNPELATRLVSLLAGIVCIPLVFSLARLFAGNRAAGLSALVCALAGLHIGYSTTSSSEMLAAALMLAGLWGVFEYQSSKRFGALLIGGVCLTGAASIRFEGWILLPLLLLLIIGTPQKWFTAEFWRSPRLRASLFFALVAGAWPVAWSLYSWHRTGDPLYSFHSHEVSLPYEVAERIDAGLREPSRLYQLSLPAGVLLLSLSPLPLIGLTCCVSPRARPGLATQFALLVLMFAAIEYLNLLRGNLAMAARYYLMQVVLLSVLSGPCLVALSRFFPVISLRRLWGLTLSSLLLTLAVVLTGSETNNPYSEKFASVSPRLRFPNYLKDAAKELRPSLRSDDAIVIDQYRGQSNLFSYALGLPLLPDERVFPVWVGRIPEVQRFVAAHHPRFIIYSDSGNLQRVLRLAPGCPGEQSAMGLKLRCLYANEVYRIYEASY